MSQICLARAAEPEAHLHPHLRGSLAEPPSRQSCPTSRDIDYGGDGTPAARAASPRVGVEARSDRRRRGSRSSAGVSAGVRWVEAWCAGPGQRTGSSYESEGLMLEHLLAKALAVGLLLRRTRRRPAQGPAAPRTDQPDPDCHNGQASWSDSVVSARRWSLSRSVRSSRGSRRWRRSRYVRSRLQFARIIETQFSNGIDHLARHPDLEQADRDEAEGNGSTARPLQGRMRHRKSPQVLWYCVRS